MAFAASVEELGWEEHDGQFDRVDETTLAHCGGDCRTHLCGLAVFTYATGVTIHLPRDGHGEGPYSVLLDPFVVNLSEDHYLNLTVALELNDRAVEKDLHASLPRVRNAIPNHSRDLSTMRNMVGKYVLRDEIASQVNGVLPQGGVRAIYVYDFLIQ